LCEEAACNQPSGQQPATSSQRPATPPTAAPSRLSRLYHGVASGLVYGVRQPTCDNDAISAFESVIDNDSDLLDKLPQPFTNPAKDRSANKPYADLPIVLSTTNYVSTCLPTVAAAPSVDVHPPSCLEYRASWRPAASGQLPTARYTLRFLVPQTTFTSMLFQSSSSRGLVLHRQVVTRHHLPPSQPALRLKPIPQRHRRSYTCPGGALVVLHRREFGMWLFTMPRPANLSSA
jgi:hypothetical protein